MDIVDKVWNRIKTGGNWFLISFVATSFLIVALWANRWPSLGARNFIIVVTAIVIVVRIFNDKSKWSEVILIALVWLVFLLAATGLINHHAFDTESEYAMYRVSKGQLAEKAGWLLSPSTAYVELPEPRELRVGLSEVILSKRDSLASIDDAQIRVPMKYTLGTAVSKLQDKTLLPTAIEYSQNIVVQEAQKLGFAKKTIYFFQILKKGKVGKKELCYVVVPKGWNERKSTQMLRSIQRRTKDELGRLGLTVGRITFADY